MVCADIEEKESKIAMNAILFCWVMLIIIRVYLGCKSMVKERVTPVCFF